MDVPSAEYQFVFPSHDYFTEINNKYPCSALVKKYASMRSGTQ